MNDRDDNRQSAKALLRELFAHCKSDSLSAHGLRERIERLRLSPNMIDPNTTDYAFRLACYNDRVTEGIIKYLIKCFPDAVSATNNDGWSPLHYACYNKNVTFNIVQLIIDAAPESVRHVNNKGLMPLHCLCDNRNVEERRGIKILKLLIEEYPVALRHADRRGLLPVHRACGAKKSFEFCRVLIEAYPGSEQISSYKGMMPLHCASMFNTFAMVEYLYKLYPDAINDAATDGGYHPIHFAIIALKYRDDPVAAVEIVKFLLDCDPNVKLQKVQGTMSLLHFASQRDYNDSNIEAALKVIKVIYDAYPEAIENNGIASNIYRYHQRIQSFINGELVYSRQAKDHRLMTRPDEKGQLPLHTALQNNVRLGSIKLLVKGNPSVIRTLDSNFAMPLHVACAQHESASVVQYLIGLDAVTLRAVDYDNNTALHYACRGAKYDTISMLIEKHGAVSVSKRNANKKLPIDLLFESSEVLDRESIEYTESIFRLLKAYPETIMNCIVNVKQEARWDDCSSQNANKRKFGDV